MDIQPNKKSGPWADRFYRRDDWIRTSDLVVPNDARYQLRHIPGPFSFEKREIQR